MATKKVIILGGGVAGLTAAHELIERGFDVEVYEKDGECGGKAQSSTKLGSEKDGESANEAARRATNGILSASGSSAPKSGVWEFSEPSVFQPLKDFDKILFEHGLPHPGFNRLRDILEWNMESGQ
jgi:flavin-dependent dehydrogenase